MKNLLCIILVFVSVVTQLPEAKGLDVEKPYYKVECQSEISQDVVIFDAMENSLKAKFHCNRVIKESWGTNDTEMVELSAIYANSEDENHEDNQFSQATPAGKLEMTVDNPNAQSFIKPGVEYYIHIEPCPRDRQSNPEVFDKHYSNT